MRISLPAGGSLGEPMERGGDVLEVDAGELEGLGYEFQLLQYPARVQESLGLDGKPPSRAVESYILFPRPRPVLMAAGNELQAGFS